VALSERIPVSFEKVWNTTYGQTAVSFKGDFRLALPYKSVSFFWDVMCSKRVVVAEVSELTTDPFFSAKDCLALEKLSIYSLEKSVTSRRNRRKTSWKRTSFNFWTGGAWSRVSTFLYKVRQFVNFFNFVLF